MSSRRFWLAATLLVAPLLSACQQQSGSPPPGGAPSIAFWQGVLEQLPDLPQKVEAILERRGEQVIGHTDLPVSRVLIYGEDGTVSVSASRINVLVTDLDDDALRNLLAMWKSIPSLAEEAGVAPQGPRLGGGEPLVVVLGSEGRISIEGPGGDTSQQINVLADDHADQTELSIHAFGADGSAALSRLASNFNTIRGPPDSEVSAGHLDLPPPGDTVSLLVIGKLRSLDIGGPTGSAVQDISLNAYLNRHASDGQPSSVAAGSPFSTRVAWQPEREYTDTSSTYSSTIDYSSEPAYAPPAAVAAPAYAAPQPAVAAQPARPMYPAAEISPPVIMPQPVLPQPQIQVPIQLPEFDPSPGLKFNPPIVLPPPVVQPVRPYVPRFR